MAKFMGSGVLDVGGDATRIVAEAARGSALKGAEVERRCVELDVRVENLARAQTISGSGQSNGPGGDQIAPAVEYVVAVPPTEARVSGGCGIRAQPLSKHHHVVIVVRAWVVARGPAGCAGRGAAEVRSLGEGEVSATALDSLPALPGSGDRLKWVVAVRISQLALVVDEGPSRPPQTVGTIVGMASNVGVGSSGGHDCRQDQGAHRAHLVSAARTRCRNSRSSRGFALLVTGSPSPSTSAASIAEGTANASFPSLLRSTLYLPCAIPVTAKVDADEVCFLRKTTTSSPA